ncbi:gb [Venturia nashicola]|uniref:Gb n=1 Tax=Venturia nashicola TaxID=86259 RepID=A0A4Z1PNP0_9PEZI|nr:gb [Venturia nashicola]TLD39576.1 gb [Venturia nashicola]
MAPSSEKTTFGVTVERSSSPTAPLTPQPHSPRLQPSKDTTMEPVTPNSAVSTHSTPAHEPHNPFSAFYTHSQAPTETDLKPPPIYKNDVESNVYLASSKSNLETTKDCTMWPSRVTLQNRAIQEKRAKSWNPMCRLTKKQKLTAQIIIALAIIGAAVGIGVGVSKAVHGGVWSGQGQSKPITTAPSKGP